MPRREDLETILVLGSGPIKIGQAAEFDFSGSQAVQALREDGYKVILVNSNPATIQNDPEMATRSTSNHYFQIQFEGFWKSNGQMHYLQVWEGKPH